MTTMQQLTLFPLHHHVNPEHVAAARADLRAAEREYAGARYARYVLECSDDRCARNGKLALADARVHDAYRALVAASERLGTLVP